MKVFGWAADEGGCYYYRIKKPLDALGKLGHDISHSMTFPNFEGMRIDDRRLPAFAEQAASDYTAIVGQRVSNAGSSLFWQALADKGAFQVFEIDDDLLNVDYRNRQAHTFYGRRDVRDRFIANIRAASRVTVSTEPLAEVMREYNSDVRVCPNSIPDWLLTHTPRRYRSRVTIGWCGSPTHEMDFAEIRDPLRQFMNRNRGVEFHCIGSDYASWMKLPAAQCRFTPWIPDVEDCFRAYDFDIGIAPLRAHKFNRSKSHIKVLECAALGIPVVASDVYPYTNFVRHGETGFLVKRDHEWGRYLRALIEDDELRNEMGAKAREHAANWTISKWAPIWEEALTP